MEPIRSSAGPGDQDPALPWPDTGSDEPVSPFLDPRLQLGSQSLPIPKFTDANPVSLQVASAPSQQRQMLAPASATVVQRGAAKLVDWFLTSILYFVPVFVWASHLTWAGRSAAISLALLLAAPALWFTWLLFNILLNGRTLGKRLFRLEVVTENGERLSPGRNFGRVWAESLSGAFLGIGYLFAVFDPAKRTLHDHLCGTRVILRLLR